jgi:hypothetical protein
MDDTIKFADSIFGAVQGYLKRSLAPVVERLSLLETRQPEKGEPGKDGRDGIDGKSVDHQAVVADVVKMIPLPKDGRDAPAVDVEKLAADVLAKVRVPVDGKDAAPVDVDKIIASILLKMPPPRDGRDGSNGKDVDMSVVKAMVGEAVKEVVPELRAEIERQVKAIPAPRDGKDGSDGENGKDGANGINGKDGASVDPQFVIAEVLKLVPTPRDGVDGKDAPPVDVEKLMADVLAKIPTPQNGKDGANGIDGKDAAAVDVEKIASDVLSRVRVPVDGKDAPPVDVEKITLDVLSRIPPPRDGRDGVSVRGEKGEPGQDGFSLDDFDAQLQGRTLTLSLASAGRVVKRELTLDGLPRYTGTFQSGKSSDCGDMVTYGGSVWMAKRDTSTSPPGDDWQLVVKGTR